MIKTILNTENIDAIHPLSTMERRLGGGVTTHNKPTLNNVAVIIFLAFSFIAFKSIAQISIIPKPLLLEVDTTRSFPICPLDDLVEAPESFADASAHLLQRLRNDILEPFDTIRRKRTTPLIKMAHVGECFPVKHAYELIVDSSGVQITATDPVGAAHAVQSLLQILYMSPQKDGAVLIPFLKVRDSPRFPHRGLLLDCSRHFFSVQTVKKYIDALSFYKMI